MNKRYVLLILLTGLSACGGLARRAAEEACLGKAATAFNGTLNQTLADGLASVDAFDLGTCPDDLKAPFTAYKYALRDANEAVKAYNANASGADEACKLGLGLTVLEMVTGQSTGLTPCKDSLSAGSDLKAAMEDAIGKIKPAESALRTAFAAHGYTDQPRPTQS